MCSSYHPLSCYSPSFPPSIIGSLFPFSCSPLLSALHVFPSSLYNLSSLRGMFTFSHISLSFLAGDFVWCISDTACIEQQRDLFLLRAMLLPVRSHGSLTSKDTDVTHMQFNGDIQCCTPDTKSNDTEQPVIINWSV